MSFDATAIGKELKGEIKGTAKAIAKELFGDTPPGMKKQTQAEFLDFIRRNWEPGEAGMAFRQGLLVRLGEEAFLDAAEAAGVIGNWEEALVMVPPDDDVYG